MRRTIIITKNKRKNNRLKKSKKAFSPGQIFVYLLSLFIVTMILLFGYKIITNFIGASSTVELLQFRKVMESHVKTYSTQYNSMDTKKLHAPADVKNICFLDYNWDAGFSIVDCDATSSVPNRIIEDSFSSSLYPREKKNFFLLDSKDDLISSFYIGNVTLIRKDASPLGCNYLCIPSSKGTFSVKIIAKGDHVAIANGDWS